MNKLNLLLLTNTQLRQTTANAQFAPPSVQSGDALWHLPRFGEQGWFLHANNGRVRACNMDKVSVWASEQHHGVQSGLWIERHTAAEPHFR